MRYLICYDIADTKLRTKVAKYLEGFAFRIQYSVFMCENTEKGMAEVHKRLIALTHDASKKTILIVPLCRSCESKMKTIGTAIESETYCIIA
ncbi:CRISPR-associated endonuclease Cas2 [Megasphaera massiliensis]|uniref:CRISPR-associated endonuclease Cas2 n=1 Tax=Megasphaera massiliensis TaxID=1232428 RepID=UPI004025597A